MALVCDGICQCEYCVPEGYFPEGPPECEGHYALRFENPRSQFGWWDAWLNGEKVSKYVNEARPGEWGYVVAAMPDVNGSIHRCRDCKAPCTHSSDFRRHTSSVCMKVVIGRVETAPMEAK